MHKGGAFLMAGWVLAVAAAIMIIAGCGPIEAVLPARQTATATAVDMGSWWFELESTRGALESDHPIQFNARANFNTTVNNQLEGFGEFDASWPLDTGGECTTVLRVPGNFWIAGEYRPEAGTNGQFYFQGGGINVPATSFEAVEETYCAAGSAGWGAFREAWLRGAGIEPGTAFNPLGDTYYEDTAGLGWRRRWDSFQEFIEVMEPMGLEGDYLASSARYLAGDIELAVSTMGLLWRFPARDGETAMVSDSARVTLHQGVMPLPTPTSAPTLPPGGGDTRIVHTVAEGDTLPSIAIQYSVSVDDILQENPELDPTALYVGQPIIIPSR